MKTVILCGGLGTRLSEETELKPKPMVTVGSDPILCHILNIYAHYGYDDFVLALGYKGNVIKDYFMHYYSLGSDFQIDLTNGKLKYLRQTQQKWRISLIDTGLHTLTGGRLLRLKDTLKDSGTFMLTYGDGVANVDIQKLADFHRSHGKLATLTAVHPPARFGALTFTGENQISAFKEKPQLGEGWINGGYFVFEPEIFNYLENDSTILEESPLERLANDGELMAFKHGGYWQCMDTLRDKNVLEKLWQQNKAPWKVWGKECSTKATLESAY